MITNAAIIMEQFQETEKRDEPPKYVENYGVEAASNDRVVNQDITKNAWPENDLSKDCPVGLEKLIQLDQLIIQQKVELMEMVSGYETNNRYSIRNIMGHQIYFAKEETDFCVRNCCGPERPFTINISDENGCDVVKITRPYRCMFYGQCFSFCGCCQDEIAVEAPIGEIVGYVKQLYEGCSIRYAIQDPKKQTVLKIHGPLYCHCYCPGDDVPFLLLSADGQNELGRVSKKWTNLFKEWFTDANNFGIKFPMDLDVRMKVVVLGAVFLIDFMYFERTGKTTQN